ncbi:MAG TPA: MerR family transcriptional regulator [Bryobacteraceae bacterium]|nr:MerR family transcriptional regulator [Bryobacteraceae bacterium]
MSAVYPIRAVAKLTGIPIETLRAWERRYQAVTPDRSARGRLYSDADVRRLQLLRAAVEGGHAIGQVAALSDADLLELAHTPPVPLEKAQSPNPNLQPLRDAIDGFDSDTINEELSKLALLLSPADLVYKVVLPLMRLVGDKWQNQTCTIAQEHMFSACMRNLLGGLVRLHRTAKGSGRVLLATPVDELHEFGILAAAMLAVAQGFQITYLGPNLPAGEILTTVEKCMPDIVALGIMKTNATPAVRAELARLASGLPVLTELWAGGTGAIEMLAGVVRNGAFILEDLEDFERHLSRWRTARSGGARL